MAFGGVLGEEPLYYLFTRQTGADRLLNLGYLTSNPDSFVAQSCESTGESRQREGGHANVEMEKWSGRSPAKLSASEGQHGREGQEIRIKRSVFPPGFSSTQTGFCQILTQRESLCSVMGR